ncbi:MULTISPECIES: CHAD domain-containing protein [Synechocystis]|uniref:CHAD domain-containing protein n=1 Tax=Synechocystis TaxID=1142 RepID=UPI0030B8F513
MPKLITFSPLSTPLGNYKYQPRMLKDKDPEDLHQLRVGMRRLRTAIVKSSVLLPHHSSN